MAVLTQTGHSFSSYSYPLFPFHSLFSLLISSLLPYLSLSLIIFLSLSSFPPPVIFPLPLRSPYSSTSSTSYFFFISVIRLFNNGFFIFNFLLFLFFFSFFSFFFSPFCLFSFSFLLFRPFFSFFSSLSSDLFPLFLLFSFSFLPFHRNVGLIREMKKRDVWASTCDDELF